MPEYITKLLHTSLADRSIARTIGVRVYQSTDAGDPDTIAGDEIHGALGDETDPPEDPSEIPDLDDPNLLYCNSNPRGQPCPDCARLIGTVWRPGHQPHVPRHIRCYCFYQKTWQPASKQEKRFASPPKQIRIAKKTYANEKALARPKTNLIDG